MAADKCSLTDADDPAVRIDNAASSELDVQVTDIRCGAEEIKVYELRPTDGRPLPPATPGAHIDVHLPNGMLRQYSLLVAEPNPVSYSIAVKRDEKSRGGSRYMHDELRAGTSVKIGPPRNNFPLIEHARHTIFIAGGIGVTPIWCMLNRLRQLGRSWQLHYSCRSRRSAIFARELAALGSVNFHFDDESDGKVLDLAAIVHAAPKDAQIYCCGPAPMMSAFEEKTMSWPRDQLHVEYFSAQEQKATTGGFVVELARSRREVFVPPGKTVLDALRDAGLNISYSCEQGICGTCETRVIEGTPDHRDALLTAAERAENDRMLICCSGSLSPRLVLDL